MCSESSAASGDHQSIVTWIIIITNHHHYPREIEFYTTQYRAGPSAQNCWLDPILRCHHSGIKANRIWSSNSQDHTTWCCCSNIRRAFCLKRLLCSIALVHLSIFYWETMINRRLNNVSRHEIGMHIIHRLIFFHFPVPNQTCRQLLLLCRQKQINFRTTTG